MDGRAQKIAGNEARRRALDERLGHARDELGSDVAIACECGRGDCEERFEVDPDLHAFARADGGRFIVVPGHVEPEAETVVRESDGVIVVEKRSGPVEERRYEDTRREARAAQDRARERAARARRRHDELSDRIEELREGDPLHPVHRPGHEAQRADEARQRASHAESSSERAEERARRADGRGSDGDQ